MNEPSPLAGFWLGGYEGADHVNGHGRALDMAQACGHLARLDEDHRRAARAGLSGVRESIGWRLAEAPGGAIDLARVRRIAASAERHGLQVLWTLMHYGLPADLSLHDDAMIDRFARFARIVAREIGALSPQAPVYTPINEINFLAWAASQPGILHPPNDTPGGDAQLAHRRGYEVKRRLVRAALAAMAAMREVDPRARFLHAEPLVHVVPPAHEPGLQALADEVGSWQWQAWDLMSGRVEPALGGHPGALDLLGVNHYHNSQWELHTGRRLEWHERDARRQSFGALLAQTWRRYRRPLVVAETSHVGSGRAAWLHEIAHEVRRMRQVGLPVQGLCLYPLVDRPDWSDAASWHRSGVWHVDPAARPAEPAEDTGVARDCDRALSRVANPAMHAALRAWQRVLPGQGRGAARAPVLLVFTHLRWQFVRHRWWQLLTRLAAHWRVVVVEEPVHGAGAARLDCQSHGPQIEVLVPHTPVPASGFDVAQQRPLLALIEPWLAAQRIARPVVWLTTPMALPLARALAPRLLVYDCADELTGFLGAPRALAALEVQLLSQADLVLAAGAALAARRSRAAAGRLHVVGNGVDAAPFARARAEGAAPSAVPRAEGTAEGWAAMEARQLQQHLPQPRLGYAGVVDERCDLALLAGIADAQPQWQIVVVGPVVKIAPAELPQRPNIHWLGEQPWDLLPALMCGWRVGLVPFCSGEAAQHGCPLKLLEYLAAGLPAVATTLHGWGWQRPPGVAVASSVDAFVAACAAALDESAAARASRLRAARGWLAGRSWQQAAEAVRQLLHSATLRHAEHPALRPRLAGSAGAELAQ